MAACLLFAAAGSIAAADSQCLSIGVSEGGATTEARAELVRTIFSRSGLCANPVITPQFRIDALEKEDKLAGDAWRDDVYLDAHPFLAKVPTPVEYFSGSLYWPRGQPDPTGLPNAVLGVMLGRSWSQDAVRGKKVRLESATNYHQLFQMLEAGRIQGFLIPTRAFALALADEASTAQYESREVMHRPIYLAISANYRDILPRLDKTIRMMAAEGTLTDQPGNQAKRK